MSYLKVLRFQDHENELQGTPDGQSATFQAADTQTTGAPFN